MLISKNQYKYGIETGPRFSSPIHLVSHHQYTLDGLLTKLSHPCHRSAPRPQSAYGLDTETERMIKDIVDKIGPNVSQKHTLQIYQSAFI